METGIVGVTEGCLLGFNKNKGQEISLRLRTDDFMGFRHYRIIIETLLHELAHMVHSEHEAPFHVRCITHYNIPTLFSKWCQKS